MMQTSNILTMFKIIIIIFVPLALASLDIKTGFWDDFYKVDIVHVQ